MQQAQSSYVLASSIALSVDRATAVSLTVSAACPTFHLVLCDTKDGPSAVPFNAVASNVTLSLQRTADSWNLTVAPEIETLSVSASLSMGQAGENVASSVGQLLTDAEELP